MHGAMRGARSPGTQWVCVARSKHGARRLARLPRHGPSATSTWSGLGLGLGFHPPAPPRGKSEAEP
eukprot:scaffold106214_cov39-Phaeocystis_antarctica.AAC.1